MKNKSLLMTIAISLIAISSFAQVKGLFTDSRDGKIYKTVTIGTQTWMAENLAYKASSGCWAYNDSVSYVATYGYLYNWETAKTVCHTGWHLPTEAEWTTLTNYLGGDSVAGGKLKEIGTTHWTSPNTGSTNSSGFTALPGGYRGGDGAFYSIGGNSSWWSSTEDVPEEEGRAWYKSMYSSVYSESSKEDYGFSVRCIRDK